MKLNLGCGEDYRKGYLNTDIRGNVPCDVLFDFNKIPYPFEDNTFDEVMMNSVIEHMDNPIEILKELTRICKLGAKIKIMLVHKCNYSAFGDLQHKHYFSEDTFQPHFLREYELEDKLKLTNMKFLWTCRWKKYIPFKKYLKLFLNGMYDRIYYELEVLK